MPAFSPAPRSDAPPEAAPEQPPRMLSLSRAWFVSLVSLAVVLLVSALDLRITSESTASWDHTSCNVTHRELLTKCATDDPSASSTTAANNADCPRTLLSFVIQVQTPYTTQLRLPPVNASWEPGPGPDPFTPNSALVLRRISNFKKNTVYGCFVHPDDPLRVSIGPQGVRSTATRGREDRLVVCAVVVLILAALSWLICAARSRQVEMDAEEWKLARILDEHRKMWLPRWLMKRISRTCRIDRDQVIADGPVECAICLDDLFPADLPDFAEQKSTQDATEGRTKLAKNRVLRIACNHLYHEECLREWVMVGEGRTCPLCHFELNKTPKEQTRSRLSVPLDQQALSSCGSSGASTPSGFRVMSPAAGHRAPWMPRLPRYSTRSPADSAEDVSAGSDEERAEAMSLV